MYAFLLQVITNINLQDSLYTHLFEAYLDHYLPFCHTIPVSSKRIHGNMQQGNAKV